MVVDQRPLGIGDRFLNRLHLLGDLKAWLARLDHLDHSTQVTVSAFQPCDEGGMTCMDRGICHINDLSSLGGLNKMVPRRITPKTSGQAKLMTTLQTIGKTAFATLLCAAVLVWSVMPTTSHAPAIIDVLQEHAEMIAEHGHSHGLEEDLAWAMHGHSHDSVDHDHSQAVVPGPDLSPLPMEIYKTAWRLNAAAANPRRLFLIERPPRV